MEFQITQGLRDALADAKVVISDAKLTVAGAASVDDMKGICRTYKSTPERLETLFDINAVSVARLFDKFAAGAAPASPVPEFDYDLAEQNAPDDKRELYHVLAMLRRDPRCMSLLSARQILLVASAHINDVGVFFKDPDVAMVLKDNCELEFKRLTSEQKQPQPGWVCALL